eukprot:1144451-Pelagomonas_calceolata.AAC.4
MLGQIMGSDPGLLSLAAHHLAHVKQAPRVDLNCGCPANIVTGHGAGSSLLRTPELLQRCVQAMVDGAGEEHQGDTSIVLTFDYLCTSCCCVEDMPCTHAIASEHAT